MGRADGGAGTHVRPVWTHCTTLRREMVHQAIGVQHAIGHCRLRQLCCGERCLCVGCQRGRASGCQSFASSWLVASRRLRVAWGPSCALVLHEVRLRKMSACCAGVALCARRVVGTPPDGAGGLDILGLRVARLGAAAGQPRAGAVHPLRQVGAVRGDAAVGRRRLR